MKTCLLLGSNLGDREAMLKEAREQIERTCGVVIQASKIHETEPWGFEADTTFLNQALLVDTTLSPESLLAHCLHIESILGRSRRDGATGYESRCIDIDVLFYQDTICHTPQLTLPHPRLHVRMFALKPLSEVAPDWRHPILMLTANEIIENLGF